MFKICLESNQICLKSNQISLQYKEMCVESNQIPMFKIKSMILHILVTMNSNMRNSVTGREIPT